MHITLIDDSIPFDGSSPAIRPMGGAEKAFAGLAGALARRGHEVTAINRCPAPAVIDGANWLPWDTPRPPTTEVLIAFRKPGLLSQVEADSKILWLASPATPLKGRASRRFLARSKPTMVFMGRAHRDTWDSDSGLECAIVRPGVGDTFLEDIDGASPPPPPSAVVTTHPRRGLDGLLGLWTENIHRQLPEATLHVYSMALDMGRNGGRIDEDLRPVFEQAMAAVDQGVVIERPLADPGMAQAYRAARVHLYPGQDREMICSTLAESQACGLPAVAQRGGAVDERILNGQTGYIVPDDNAMVNVALKLLGDDDAHRSMASDARAMQRQHDWDQAAAGFEALWQ